MNNSLKKILIPDDFLSNIFKKKCFHVKSISNKFLFEKNAFYSYKLPFSSTAIKKCQEKKILYINSLLILKKNIKKNNQTVQNKNIIYTKLVKKENLKDLYTIAENIAKTSRFYKDIKTKKYAIKLYKTWIYNSFFKDYAMDYILAKQNEQIVGLCTLTYNHKRYFIDLIGINKNFQHKSIGSDMLSLIEKKYPSKTIYIETEAENLPALNFYLKNKFTIDSHFLVFHKST